VFLSFELVSLSNCYLRNTIFEDIDSLWCEITVFGSNGRDITAQEVSCRLPTVETRFRAQVRSCGICGAGFLRVCRFPLPILIPPTAPHSSSLIRGWHNKPGSDRRTKCTQPHPTPRKNYRDTTHALP
jgi:hypothetical protein